MKGLLRGMSRAFGVMVRNLGCHEWNEQFRICCAVIGGNGNVLCGSASVIVRVE